MDALPALPKRLQNYDYEVAYFQEKPAASKEDTGDKQMKRLGAKSRSKNS